MALFLAALRVEEIFLLAFVLLPLLGRIVDGLAKAFTRRVAPKAKPPAQAPTPAEPSPVREMFEQLFGSPEEPAEEEPERFEDELSEEPAPPPEPVARKAPLRTLDQQPALPRASFPSAAARSWEARPQPVPLAGAILEEPPAEEPRTPADALAELRSPTFEVSADARSWRRVVVLSEILGPPVSLRSEPFGPGVPPSWS